MAAFVQVNLLDLYIARFVLEIAGGLTAFVFGCGVLTLLGYMKPPEDVLPIYAGLFFLTSLILSILAGYNRKPTSILGGSTPSAPVSAPGAPAPPLNGGQGGLLKQLQGGAPSAPPAAPAAPSGPQVPQSK